LIGTSGAPNTLNHGVVCDRPSNRIEPVPSPMITMSKSVQPPESRPVANGRRWTRSVSRSSPNGARRFSSPNQTLNVSPSRRQAFRPNWDIIASVNAV